MSTITNRDELVNKNIRDLEQEAFALDDDNRVNKRVLISKAEGSLGGILNGVNYDFVSVAYPTTTTEVFTFKEGGAGGTTTATITIVYTDTTKEFISTVTKA